MKVKNLKDMIKMLTYRDLHYEESEHYFILGGKGYEFLKGDMVLDVETLEFFKSIGLNYQSYHLGGMVFEKEKYFGHNVLETNTLCSYTTRCG